MAVTTAIQVVRTAGSATGDTAPAFLGHPKAWGMVALKVNPNSTTVGPRKVENVGGGTWVYGSGPDGTWKACWSEYFHSSKNHSATAIIANGHDRETAGPGSWADAWAEAGYGYTCYAYWSTY